MGINIVRYTVSETFFNYFSKVFPGILNFLFRDTDFHFVN